MKRSIIGLVLIAVLVAGCIGQTPSNQQKIVLNESDISDFAVWWDNSIPCNTYKTADWYKPGDTVWGTISSSKMYFTDYSSNITSRNYCCIRKLDGLDVGFGGTPGRHIVVISEGARDYKRISPIGSVSIFENHTVEMCCYLCDTDNSPISNEVCVKKNIDSPGC
jgi:hypothetical protein